MEEGVLIGVLLNVSYILVCEPVFLFYGVMYIRSRMHHIVYIRLDILNAHSYIKNKRFCLVSSACKNERDLSNSFIWTSEKISPWVFHQPHKEFPPPPCETSCVSEGGRGGEGGGGLFTVSSQSRSRARSRSQPEGSNFVVYAELGGGVDWGGEGEGRLGGGGGNPVHFQIFF